MAYSQKISEAKKIKDIEDRMAFILKYHPALDRHHAALRDVLVSLDEHSFHKEADPLKDYRRQSSLERAEFKKRIKALESFRRKILKWLSFQWEMSESTEPDQKLNYLINEVDAALATHKKHIRPEDRGPSRAYLDLSFLAGNLLYLWKEVLGHKHFLYDAGNKDEDLANQFVEDFILAEYNGKRVKEVRGLESAIKSKRDVRKKRKSQIFKK